MHNPHQGWCHQGWWGLLLAAASAHAAKNVLFFVCDDLRPEMNAAYNKPFMHTPHFDKFASEALVFDRAYTNFAICSPSRNSFMSGRPPDETRVWNFRQDFREAGLSKAGVPGSEWVTLPEYFKDNGYLTLGHGKLYHPGKPPNWDEPKSWSQLQPYGRENIAGCASSSYCPRKGTPESFSDYNTTIEAIVTLGRMQKFVRNNATPFFLGVGMHHPHASWATPTELAWLYAGATKGLPGVVNPYTPTNAPDVAISAELDGNDHIALDWTSPDLANRTQDPDLPQAANGVESVPLPSPGNNTVPAYFAQYMRLGYYTAVTHSDAHFGMMMDALDASGLANDTLVVLFGDHGWELGEHTHYGKHTNFDLSVHVPLLMRAPWLPASAGKHTQSVVELLDLYRTISALAGLPPPPSDVAGDDFSALFSDPTQSLKTEAYAQYSRCPGERDFPTVYELPDWALNNCEDVPVVNISFMGYTVRSLDWRFTEWYVWDRVNCAAEFDSVPHATELYSHAGHTNPGEFDAYENENVAAAPANAQTVATLRAKLWARFKTTGSGCPPDQPGSLETPFSLPRAAANPSGIPGAWDDPPMPAFYNSSATRATASAIASCTAYAEGTMIPWSQVVHDWVEGGGRVEDCAAALIIASGETSCTLDGCESVQSGIWQVTSPDMPAPSGCLDGDTNPCCTVDFVRNHITSYLSSKNKTTSWQVGCIGEFNKGNAWPGDPTNPTHTLPPSYPIDPTTIVPRIVPADHSGASLGGTQSNWLGPFCHAGGFTCESNDPYCTSTPQKGIGGDNWGGGSEWYGTGEGSQIYPFPYYYYARFVESQGDGAGNTGDMFCMTVMDPVGQCGGVASQQKPNCSQPVNGQAPSAENQACLNTIVDTAVTLAKKVCAAALAG